MPLTVNKKYYLWLGLVSVVFFFVYLFLYYDASVWPLGKAASYNVDSDGAASREREPVHLILNQPDESVNYFFIRRYALNNEFGHSEPLSELAHGQVHPRSTTVVRGKVVPIGFPGIIILYGSLAKLTVKLVGAGWFNFAAIMLTPLFAVIMPWFLFGLTRRIFNDRVGFLSALMAFVLPPWWYYASRPLQHNTLFVTLVIIFLYFAIRLWEKRLGERSQTWLSFSLGLTFALALYIRPSEVVWLSAAALVFIILGKELLTAKNIFSALLPIIVVAGLFFVTQNLYYGSPFASGYVKPLSNGDGASIFSGPQGISFTQALLAPFGVHPRESLMTAYRYLARLFLPWFLVIFSGYMLFDAARTEKKKSAAINSWLQTGLNLANLRRARVYGACVAVLTIYLLVYYGSWLFTDNLAGAISIGSSQVRYFLPLYVLALPFAALTISLVMSLGKSGKLMSIVALAALTLISFRSVFVSFEGLMQIKDTVATYYDWRDRMINKTEADAIIVTRYADKYLFPFRKVISGWFSDEEVRAITALASAGRPVYWFDITPDVSRMALFEQRLAIKDYKLGEPVAKWADLALRPLIKVKP